MASACTFPLCVSCEICGISALRSVFSAEANNGFNRLGPRALTFLHILFSLLPIMADNPPIDPAQPRAASPAEIRRTESASERTIDVEQPTSTAELKAEDIPPDGGYGWVCVACNFFINGHTWGINSTYGVFLGYYLSTDYFPNTSPSPMPSLVDCPYLRQL